VEQREVHRCRALALDIQAPGDGLCKPFQFHGDLPFTEPLLWRSSVPSVAAPMQELDQLDSSLPHTPLAKLLHQFRPVAQACGGHVYWPYIGFILSLHLHPDR
jgi:hypothetical protein